MHDLPGKIIWIIAAVVMLFTFHGITVAQGESIDKRALYTDMCDFVDGVVDSRVITESELREFNATIASYGFSVDYEITRLVRSVDPDPLHENEYVPTWIEVDDNMHYNQGDKIVLHVWETGTSSNRNILVNTGMFGVDKFDEVVPARVR